MQEVASALRPHRRDRARPRRCARHARELRAATGARSSRTRSSRRSAATRGCSHEGAAGSSCARSCSMRSATGAWCIVAFCVMPLAVPLVLAGMSAFGSTQAGGASWRGTLDLPVDRRGAGAEPDRLARVPERAHRGGARAGPDAAVRAQRYEVDAADRRGAIAHDWRAGKPAHGRDDLRQLAAAAVGRDDRAGARTCSRHTAAQSARCD